jgi:hypothetical protein
MLDGPAGTPNTLPFAVTVFPCLYGKRLQFLSQVMEMHEQRRPPPKEEAAPKRFTLDGTASCEITLQTDGKAEPAPVLQQRNNLGAIRGNGSSAFP